MVNVGGVRKGNGVMERPKFFDERNPEYTLDMDKFHVLVDENFVPLPIKIDVELFEKQMREHHHLFTDWGNRHPEMFRKGLPLVNRDGEVDPSRRDPCVEPLDQWNDDNPHDKLFDPDLSVPTELLELECFDPLEPLKNYMIRSAIIWFNKGSFFYPHRDQFPPELENIRLWGTNKPEEYRFVFLDGSTYSSREIEAGRIYLIDTTKTHYPEAGDDEVYTMFLSVDVRAYDILLRMKNEAANM